MSRTDLTSSISNLVEFIKEKTANNLVEASRLNTVDLNDQQLEKILRIVEASASQAFTLSIDEIERTLDTYSK